MVRIAARNASKRTDERMTESRDQDPAVDGLSTEMATVFDKTAPTGSSPSEAR
ncbi:hypothetical protein [Haloprofundus salinisoli]|uniref:hypothetical protein n=1 Tax=Haloprofundus salinisoli TaxID=2876193 RepID=UPI001CCFD88F|nr:hypothetical protein [Haloprofundus salinisoli]